MSREAAMKIGMVFPGYGNTFIGMGKELYDEHRLVQDYFEDASQCLNINFVKLCFASSDAEVTKIHYAYPILFLMSSAIYALLKEQGIKPSFIAGMDIGEYAALFAAGSISFPDGLYLLSKLAAFYEDALPHIQPEVIRVQGIELEILKKLCIKAAGNEPPSISLYYSAHDHVVAGEMQAIQQLKHMLGETAAIVTPDVLERGLYSPLMDSVAQQFKIYLEKVDFKQARTPVINSSTGGVIVHASDIRTHIVERITSPIEWELVLNAFAGVDLIIQVGASALLQGLIVKKYPDKRHIAITRNTDIEKIHTYIDNSSLET